MKSFRWHSRQSSASISIQFTHSNTLPLPIYSHNTVLHPFGLLHATKNVDLFGVTTPQKSNAESECAVGIFSQSKCLSQKTLYCMDIHCIRVHPIQTGKGLSDCIHIRLMRTIVLEQEFHVDLPISWNNGISYSLTPSSQQRLRDEIGSGSIKLFTRFLELRASSRNSC